MYGDWPYENGELQAKLEDFSGFGCLIVPPFVIEKVDEEREGRPSIPPLTFRDLLVSSMTESTLLSFESDFRE